MKKLLFFAPFLTGFLNYAFAVDIRNIRCAEVHKGIKHVLTIASIDLNGKNSIGQNVKIRFYQFDRNVAKVTFDKIYEVPISNFISERYYLDFTKLFHFPGHSSGEIELAFREYYETGMNLITRELIDIEEVKAFAQGGLNGGAVYRCKINFRH